MHSVHLEFNTIAEMEEFFSQRKPYDVPLVLGAQGATPINVVATPTSYGLLQELLEDPKYEWRKMSTLVEKTGLSANNIIEHFQKENIKYDIQQSRDGGQLVKAVY